MSLEWDYLIPEMLSDLLLLHGRERLELNLNLNGPLYGTAKER